MAFARTKKLSMLQDIDEAGSILSIARLVVPPLFILSADWDIIDALIEEKEFGGLWWW